MPCVRMVLTIMTRFDAKKFLTAMVTTEIECLSVTFCAK